MGKKKTIILFCTILLLNFVNTAFAEIVIKSPYRGGGYWYRGQTHSHSNLSIGTDDTTPAEVENTYKQIGYDFIMLTDHDLATANPFVEGILHITGEELISLFNSDEDMRIRGRHLIALGIEDRVSAITIQGAIDEIAAEGGIAAIAHPNFPEGGDIYDIDSLLYTYSGYNLIEVQNKVAENRYPGTGAAFDIWDTLLSNYIEVWGVGVDDCHNYIQSPEYDHFCVVVSTDSDTISQADIINALKLGDFYSTQGSLGPVINSVTIGPDQINIALPTVTGNYTINWIGDNGTLLAVDTDVETQASLTPSAGDKYVRIEVVRNSDANMAWTNPMFVYDADIATIVTTILPNGTEGEVYNEPLSAFGGAVPYSWSLISGSFPLNLELNSTGVISGRPTLFGNYEFSVQVADNNGNTDIQDLRIVIAPVPPLFSDDFQDENLTGWTVVDEGDQDAPSAWSISSGKLNQGSNIWGGSFYPQFPDKPGTYVYAGSVNWKNYRFITKIRSNDDDYIGVMFRFQNTNNYYQFYMSEQDSFRRLVKKIDGQVFILAEEGTGYVPGQEYGLRVEVVGDNIRVYLDNNLVFDVTDSSLGFGKIALYCWANPAVSFDDVKVSPALTITTFPDLPEGTIYSSYNTRLTAIQGVPPHTWSIISGSLPQGLSLSLSGIISGIPEDTGTFSVEIKVQDSESRHDTQSFSLYINSLPPIFQDDFQDNDMAGWQIKDEGTHSAPSEWYVSGGGLFQGSNIWGGTLGLTDPHKPGTYASTGDGNWTDYELRCKIRSQDNDGIGVMVRYQDEDNYYQFWMSRQYHSRRLLKRANGVTTVLAEDTISYEEFKDYHLRINILDKRIRVILDNELIFDVTDDSADAIGSGMIALYSWANAGVLFDDVLVIETDYIPLAITTTNLSAGAEGEPYSFELGVSGGVSPYNWYLEPGYSLPDGMSLINSGMISGIPSVKGTYQFAIGVEDFENSWETQLFTFIVNEGFITLFEASFNSGDISGWDFIDGVEAVNSAPSSWSVSGGVLTQYSNIWGGVLSDVVAHHPGTYALAGDLLWMNYEMSLDISSVDNDLLGVVFRYQDQENYYQFYMSRQYGYRRLLKRVGGVSTVIAEDLHEYSLLQWYALKISIAGYSIRIYLDDVLLFDLMDESLANGKIGMYCWANAGSRYDNINVIVPESFNNPVIIDNSKEEPTSLPPAIRTESYARVLQVIGGAPPYQWDLVTGSSLPTGLFLSSGGDISGIPEVTDTTIFTVEVTDDQGGSDTSVFSLTVNPYIIPLFADSFTDGNFDDWQVVDEGVTSRPSKWYISNGYLFQDSNIWGGALNAVDPYKPGTHLLNGDTIWTDYELKLKIRSGDDDVLGIMMRYQDIDNYYQFYMSNQFGYRRLVKRSGGISYSLVQDSFNYEINKWYELKMVIVGNRIEVFMDNVLVFDYTDEGLTIPAGKIGLYSWANTGSIFDDIEIRTAE